MATQRPVTASRLGRLTLLGKLAGGIAGGVVFEIPEVVESLTTSEVLAMTYLNGQPIEALADLPPTDRKPPQPHCWSWRFVKRSTGVWCKPIPTLPTTCMNLTAAGFSCSISARRGRIHCSSGQPFVASCAPVSRAMTQMSSNPPCKSATLQKMIPPPTTTSSSNCSARPQSRPGNATESAAMLPLYCVKLARTSHQWAR